MTKENENILLKVIAWAHLGDTKFEKRWGINVTPNLVVPNGDREFSDSELVVLNDSYESIFVSQVSEKLNERGLPEAFFKDLVFGGCSVITV